MSTLTKGQAFAMLDVAMAERRGSALLHELRAHLSALHDEADRLQSAHDAEVGALRMELDHARAMQTVQRNELESAESRLREAHGLLREADRFLGFEGAEGELSDRIDRAMGGEDG